MKPKSLLQECSKWVNFTHIFAASRKIIDQNCGDYINRGFRDSLIKSRSVMILSLLYFLLYFLLISLILWWKIQSQISIG